MTLVSNPSEAAVLTVTGFPTALLPVLNPPISGEILLVVMLNGQNVIVRAGDIFVGGGGLLPLTTGELPGPVLVADPYGQCIGVPVA